MILHWQSVQESGSRTEKSQAVIFLKSWAVDSFNRKLTVLCADLLLQFRNLQKEAQRSFITLPDLLTYRDRVLKALELMETIPYPGGREEQSGTYDVQDVGEDDEQVQQESSTKRR